VGAGADDHGDERAGSSAESTEGADYALAETPSPTAAVALARLDRLARRLRRDCPWDREQNERTIVPHTVEEAYEVADAALAADDAKLIDELGDLLYQVVFLALLLEERGVGDFAAVADGLRRKLIRRHPHVFGDVRASSADEAVRTWSEVKRHRERGGATFADIATTPPATLRARKVLRRARAAGLLPDRTAAECAHALADQADRAGRGRSDAERSAADSTSEREAGRILLCAVELALALGADPELALRRAADELAARLEPSDRAPHKDQRSPTPEAES